MQGTVAMAQTQTGGDVRIARGVLIEKSDDRIVLALPGTDYQIHLVTEAAVTGEIGKPISGKIVASAKRIDKARSGGRFIEPVYGRPRKLQGRVVATDTTNGTITVACPCPVTCRTMAPQSPSDFAEGDFVTFDVERGARFEPAS